MKQAFRKIRLSTANKERLAQINAIIEEYRKLGHKLTLRQLFYQLVSRDIIPNEQTQYSALSKVLKEGRMAGIVDWDAIEDRLRVPYSPPSWDSPEDMIDFCASIYKLPRMEGQQNYVEVWVEKDALSGVLKRVTSKYQIPILVNRGYSSVTAMKDAFDRILPHLHEKRNCHVIYIGDFDPSGQDMIRDITDRVNEFIMGYFFNRFNLEMAEEMVALYHVNAVALTKAQIKRYKPPPNPAKKTDTRAAKYIAKNGEQSWEVDALRPEVLHKIVEDAILELIDEELYKEILGREEGDREKLEQLKDHL